MTTQELINKYQLFSYRMFGKVIQSNLDYNFSTLMPLGHKLADLKANIIINPLILINNIEKFNNYSLEFVLSELSSQLITTQEANKTFYKSWQSIITKSDSELAINQMLHYLTTYGLNLPQAYYPDDILGNLPKQHTVTTIDSFSLEEFKRSLETLAYNNIALGDEVYTLVNAINDFDISITIAEVKNKELKVALYKATNTVPEDPEEFLKYIYYRATLNTLFVQNQDTFGVFSNLDADLITLILNFDITALASIFRRFKRCFLAMKKSDKQLVTFINKVSKLASKYHKPIQTPNYLKAMQLNKQEFLELATLDTSYLVKLYNYINYLYVSKQKNNIVQLYRIRNGKTYLTTKPITYKKSKLFKRKNTVKLWIEQKLKNSLNFKLDAVIDYAVPSTGKQFIGDIPFGSTVDLASSTIVGIYWENQNKHQIDLDLSVSNETSKIGWDSSHYSNGATFSGDITDAPNGASECVYINEDKPLYKIDVNFYNYGDIVKCPFKFYLATGITRKQLKANFMVDANDIMYQRQLIVQEAMSPGTVYGNKFIFDNFSIPTNSANIPGSDYFKAIGIMLESKLRFSDLNLEFIGAKSISELSKAELLALVQ